MNIEALQNYFKDALLLNTLPSDYEHYYWFTSTTNDTIGIRKDTCSNEQVDMLRLFLTPLESQFILPTSSQLQWNEYLFSETDATLPESFQSLKNIRFVQFYLQSANFDREFFEESLRSFFPHAHEILWRNQQYGVIIEAKKDFKVTEDELQSFSKTIQSDFYTDCFFFIGLPYTVQQQLQQAFRLEQKAFDVVKVYPKFHEIVFHMSEAIALLLLERQDEWFPEYVEKFILHEIAEDDELLTTVFAYLNCNLNVSLTAKQLFMHRNSLQYRIDKFCEKTGLDVRNFSSAVSAYLLLLLYEKK